MRRPPPARRLLLLACLCVAAPSAAALELASVDVRGLGDDAQRQQVLQALSLERLNPNRRKALTEARLSYLLRQAPGEARRALEPYGYYDAEATLTVEREGERVKVRVDVAAGEPVRVRNRDIVVTGAAGADEAITRRLRWMRPREGDAFAHEAYETAKANMDRALAARGYFDARLDTHRVEVGREARTADITLAWDSGERYALGEARFSGHPFRPGLLEHLVPWTPGDAYEQSELLALQSSLAELDYFAAIDLQPRPEDADGERRVPVDVALSPAKRSVYSAGLRFGTDSGLGLTGGYERRWLNDRGHKFDSLASLAQRRSDLGARYRIPAFAWLDGWYTASANLRREEVDGVRSELLEAVASRSGRWRDWELVAALNLRRERFEDAASGDDFLYSTLVYPSLWAKWSDADDPLYPRRARALTVELRAGSSAIGSDIDFLQLRAEARWVRAFGRRDRLLLRAEAGTTISGGFPDFPPSLRFYAGGDRSVRGYGYKEIGQTLTGLDGTRYVFGGKHLLVASAEWERMFTREWGAAVFVDAGDAFDGDGSIDPQVGLGAGLRWRSPVGPVRVDVAHGFGGDAQQSIRLHLNIGPDL